MRVQIKVNDYVHVHTQDAPTKVLCWVGQRRTHKLQLGEVVDCMADGSAVHDLTASQQNQVVKLLKDLRGCIYVCIHERAHV